MSQSLSFSFIFYISVRIIQNFFQKGLVSLLISLSIFPSFFLPVLLTIFPFFLFVTRHYFQYLYLFFFTLLSFQYLTLVLLSIFLLLYPNFVLVFLSYCLFSIYETFTLYLEAKFKDLQIKSIKRYFGGVFTQAISRKAIVSTH